MMCMDIPEYEDKKSMAFLESSVVKVGKTSVTTKSNYQASITIMFNTKPYPKATTCFLNASRDGGSHNLPEKLIQKPHNSFPEEFFHVSNLNLL